MPKIQLQMLKDFIVKAQYSTGLSLHSLYFLHKILHNGEKRACVLFCVS